MENTKKNWLAMGAATALLTTALAGCGNSNSNSNASPESSAPSSSTSTQTEASKPADKGEVPTLVWWTIGGTVPANFDKAIAAMNEYTA